MFRAAFHRRAAAPMPSPHAPNSPAPIRHRQPPELSARFVSKICDSSVPCASLSQAGNIVHRVSTVNHSPASLCKCIFIPTPSAVEFPRPKTKRPPIDSGASSRLFSASSEFFLSSVLISSLSFFSLRPYLFTSLLHASGNALHPAPPKGHRAPHSSSPESPHHSRQRALPTIRAKPHDAPCPLPHAPRNTLAPPPASRRKTSSAHQS